MTKTRMLGKFWASLVAQRVKCLPAMWETWVQSLGWGDPLEKEMATHSPVLFPGKSHRWRSLVGYSPWSSKELDTMVSYFPSLREILVSNTTAAENSKHGPISSQINMNTYTKGLFNSSLSNLSCSGFQQKVTRQTKR